jgi:DNA-binding transcriptional ArsR family regulator
MPRSATTSDVFNAVAEPRRRRILDFLTHGEQPVNAVVESLRMGQPTVSKHLGVLKQVGLVSVRGSGRQRLYRVNAEGLKPIHDWVKAYEKLWNDRLDRLEDYLQQLQSRETTDEPA